MPLPLIEPQENRQPIRCDAASMAKPRPSPVGAAAMHEFGRFQVLLRRRKLLSEAVPIELGTRAFDLLLVLLEADGALVTKEELLGRVWPGIVVAEENLKVQISALRKALGENRDFIHTEFGRGYRFTAAVRSTADWTGCRLSTRRRHRSRRRRRAQGPSLLKFHRR
jgi:DNA-binding winged helix-turn-helix (wHTH) protein